MPVDHSESREGGFDEQHRQLKR